MKEILLGVNIDHVATLRNARGEKYPSVIEAALCAESAGATSIVSHLREDRRHIKDEDIFLLKKVIKTKLNMEMALNDEIIKISFDLKPHKVTLVPERREEITTEGGLDIKKHKKLLKELIPEYKKNGIETFLFIEPDIEMVELSAEIGVTGIELHTGKYSNAEKEEEIEFEFKKVLYSAKKGFDLGLKVAAGHGLDYHNVYKIASIKEIYELNIGFSIIAHSIFYGLETSIKELINIMYQARNK